MNFQLRMLIAAPILIAAICSRPSYALEVDNESAYQKGLALYLKCETETDRASAAVFFKEAGEHGHIEAAFSLGVLYQNGEGVRQNSDEAIKWYTIAADQNHIKAQFNLGHLLFEGIGIKRDPISGVRWFQKAAEQNDAKAQYKVGCAYLSGQGVSKNFSLALEWLNKSAKQGDKDAIHTLGLAREMHAQKH